MIIRKPVQLLRTLANVGDPLGAYVHCDRRLELRTVISLRHRNMRHVRFRRINELSSKHIEGILLLLRLMDDMARPHPRVVAR